MSGQRIPLSDRIFRFALRFFPDEFRGGYGREMERVFREQRRETKEQGGVMGFLKLWWETLAGIFTTAPREHWEILKQDCAYAFRMMRKNKGFTALAVLTLGLGIGANTAIFSVVNAVLLRPLPYPQGNQLVVVRQQALGAGFESIGFSVKEMDDYRSQSQALAGLEEYHAMTFTLLGREEPLRVQTGVVSSGFFDLFGVKPLLGRTFNPDDDKQGAPAVLLVSYEFWRHKLNGDPDIVGKTFEMNDKVHTVIGVLPPVPQYPNENDVYMPTSACPFRSSKPMIENRDHRMMSAFGRTKPGVPLNSLNADISTIAGRLKQEYPDNYPQKMGYGAVSVALQGELTRQARPTLLVLLAAAGFVLLIACANVANLTLARMAQREREMAVRSALGAGRGRLLRQLFTESVMIALLGAMLGLLLASGGLQLLTSFAAKFTPRAREINIDRMVLLFALLAAIATSIVAGTVSALFSRENLVSGLKERTGGGASGRSRNRVRSLLIVSQVAFSFLLLAGAGLMLRSFIKLQQVDPGFISQRVLTMGISLNFTKYTTPQQVRDVSRRILEQVQRQPGVLSAAISSGFPFDPDSLLSGSNRTSFTIEGRPVASNEFALFTTAQTGSPDYFKTVGIPLLAGRTFTDGDTSETMSVAIINKTLAGHRWKGEDPIGKRVSFDEGKTWTTIVGVVGDTRDYGLDRPVDDIAYVPLEQLGFPGTIVAHTIGDPLSISRQMRQSVYDVDPQTAITNEQTLEQARDATLTSPRLTTNLLGIFAGLALVMAATGIGGMMALAVSQRTHEIGVRMALGASPREVIRMILRQGLTLGVAGIAIGLLAALGLTRMLQTLLFEISPTDPATFAGVALVLISAAVLSCTVPARRAAQIDPLDALRSE